MARDLTKRLPDTVTVTSIDAWWAGASVPEELLAWLAYHADRRVLVAAAYGMVRASLAWRRTESQPARAALAAIAELLAGRSIDLEAVRRDLVREIALLESTEVAAREACHVVRIILAFASGDLDRSLRAADAGLLCSCLQPDDDDACVRVVRALRTVVPDPVSGLDDVAGATARSELDVELGPEPGPERTWIRVTSAMWNPFVDDHALEIRRLDGLVTFRLDVAARLFVWREDPETFERSIVDLAELPCALPPPPRLGDADTVAIEGHDRRCEVDAALLAVEPVETARAIASCALSRCRERLEARLQGALSSAPLESQSAQLLLEAMDVRGEVAALRWFAERHPQLRLT